MAAKRGKSQARRNSGGGRGGLPGWAWLLTGLLVGVGLAAWVLHRQGLLSADTLLPKPDPSASAPREPEPPVAQQPAKSEPTKPKYEFYTVLKEREVQIPDAELAEQAKQPPPASSAEPTAERLFLQAGAFADPARAEEVKAAIAFSGLIARIEPTQNRNGQTVHRVMLGPFASSRELEAAKTALAGSGVQAIAIRDPAR